MTLVAWIGGLEGWRNCEATAVAGEAEAGLAAAGRCQAAGIRSAGLGARLGLAWLGVQTPPTPRGPSAHAQLPASWAPSSASPPASVRALSRQGSLVGLLQIGQDELQVVGMQGK